MGERGAASCRSRRPWGSPGRISRDWKRTRIVVCREAIRLVFRKFQEVGTVRQTLLWFLEEGLRLPMHQSESETVWKRPTYATVYRILTHPAYGGSLRLGKTEMVSRYDKGLPRKGCRRKPPDRWLALIPNTHEGYVDWETFQQIRRAIARESSRSRPFPAEAKRGLGILAGLLRCRRCGRKLEVRYRAATMTCCVMAVGVAELDNGEPTCIAFGGIPVDEEIGRQVRRVLQPAAVEAAVQAHREEQQHRDEVQAALRAQTSKRRVMLQSSVETIRRCRSREPPGRG